MKKQILFFTVAFFSILLNVDAKEIQVSGELIRATKVNNVSEGTVTDTYTCRADASKTCFTITINNSPLVAKDVVPYVTDGMIAIGDNITIVDDDGNTSTGNFVSYANYAVEGEVILTRDHVFIRQINN
jgi:hypothetical protein